MNDERLSEKIKKKQRIMNSEFESIFNEAKAELQKIESDTYEFPHFIQEDDQLYTNMNFTISNESASSRNTSRGSSVSLIVNKTLQRPNKRKETLQEKLLLNIDKTLKKGRMLRKSIVYNCESCSNNSGSDEASTLKSINSSQSLEKNGSVFLDEKNTGNMIKGVQNQECQTEDLIEIAEKPNEKISCNNSLSDSSSTSYKSLPGGIHGETLHSLLDSFGTLKRFYLVLSFQSFPKMYT